MATKPSNTGWGGRRPNTGGARPGAGRPSLPPEERKRRVMVQLTDAQIEQARNMGDGNLSEGIRRALQRAD